MQEGLIHAIEALYPWVSTLPPETRATLFDHDLLPITAAAGEVLFDQGAPCQGFPMVVDGDVRVARGSPQGRSLELYRVAPGELCIVSASCLFSGTPTAAFGQAHARTTLALMPPQAFERLLAHAAFRRSVFQVFGARMADLMTLVEAVAFQRLDERLARALAEKAPAFHGTHQNLADELGTVREIVTRLLHRFERDGLVALGRERIEILQPQALTDFSAGRART